MNKTDVRILQQYLRENGTYSGKLDGIRGPMTHAAVGATLEAHADTLPEDAGTWSDRRRTVVCLQLACRERKIEVGPLDSLARVLDRVYDHYGPEQLRDLGLHRYGGCYNKCRKRGGTAWSTHAWGIAIDWDPAHNKLKWGRDRAHLAGSEYATWWQIWEEEGWVSLGRTRNFDWMHVQAAKP